MMCEDIERRTGMSRARLLGQVANEQIGWERDIEVVVVVH
jgi:hypothetical protein